MTLRCALYARYSSDQQRAASIEDQFRVCRERAEREGWKIAGAYKDSAVSGASMILRPGIQALLDDARRGLFEIVVAEALDRVSRDQADVATLYKHLKFAGVMIVTLSEGEINELHVGLKGAMNALFLKDLAAKTHRGLRGRVEQGRSGGGLCYGYDVVKSLDGSGDPVRVTPVLGVRIAGPRRPIDRLKPHQTHQTAGPAAPDPHALAAQMKRHPARAVERILQEQIVDPPHQRQRLRALPRRLVVERRPPDRQQTALPAQAQRRMIALHHRPTLGPAHRPDPRDKRSRSTILA